jgi:hypothetical protein|tara:strand:- start:216 stop:647 length:432 start_codon:yes stop_codon:yes gene_type:complete
MKRYIGGKTSGKKKGPKSKPKPHNLKPSKKKKKKKQQTKMKPKVKPKNKYKNKTTYTLSQPKKRRYSVHMPRFTNKRNRVGIIRRPAKPSFQSVSYSDASSYSNMMGTEDFKRRAMGRRNMDGKLSGVNVDQDNDMIRIHRFP